MAVSWWNCVKAGASYHDRLVQLSVDPHINYKLLVQALGCSTILSTLRLTQSWCRNLINWLGKQPMYQQDIPNLDHKLNASKLLVQEKGLQLKQIAEGTSTILRTYTSLKVTYGREQYLSSTGVKSLRLLALLSCFRCGQHGLEVQLGRHATVCVAVAARTCCCCTLGEIVDENHFCFPVLLMMVLPN